MKAFWADVLEPLLDITTPGTIVEIGAEVGGNTTKLVRWATEHGATLHSIDPVPGTAVRNLAREHPETFVLHRALSLAALPAIADPDVVLVDGDHNWYTVNAELTLMAREYANWPLTVLHDIGRPYGRLDMYYKPENVPVEWRQPYERARNGRGTAIRSGGPNNGVLTAVEDFLAATELDLAFFTAKGPGGLGILVDRERLAAEPELTALLGRVHDPEYAAGLSPDRASAHVG